MNTTRRQHYVWKHYLRGWEESGLISVLQKRNARIFPANAINVAVMKDFYRLPILSEEDIAFLNKFIDETCKLDMLRELNRGWLMPLATHSRIRRELAKHGKLDPLLEKQIEHVEIQTDEQFHGSIENNAVPLIDALREGHAELWSNDNHSLKLAYFLCLQHFRTKKMRDNILEGFSNGAEREAAARRWPVLRHILVTNMAWSIYYERSNWRLRLLRASGSILFITGDQPTMNLLQPIRHNDLAFYYPVSPTTAAILEHRENNSVVGIDDNLTEEAIEGLNRRIYDFSHDQVFGVDMSYLTRFLR